MATLTPSRMAPLRQGYSDSEHLARILRPWRRRLIAQQLTLRAMRGLVFGLVLAALVLLLSRLLPLAGARFWAVGLGFACPLIAVIATLWLRPSLAQTARLVDRRLALHDRLGTDWELRK